MMVFKRKQIVVLSLVLMLVIAGYLQYSYNKSSKDTASETGKVGEAVYVDNQEVAAKDQNTNDKSDKTDKKPAKTSSASKQANDYFAQAKMDREMVRGRDTDAMKQVSGDTTATKDLKSKAYDKMIKITEYNEKEMKIETLIKDKGFEDVLALFGDDGSLDVVVKAPSLTTAQIAQITDVASRQGNIEIDKIRISAKY